MQTQLGIIIYNRFESEKSPKAQKIKSPLEVYCSFSASAHPGVTGASTASPVRSSQTSLAPSHWADMAPARTLTMASHPLQRRPYFEGSTATTSTRSGSSCIRPSSSGTSPNPASNQAGYCSCSSARAGGGAGGGAGVGAPEAVDLDSKS